jgi:hypothetical protein
MKASILSLVLSLFLLLSCKPVHNTSILNGDSSWYYDIGNNRPISGADLFTILNINIPGYETNVTAENKFINIKDHSAFMGYHRDGNIALIIIAYDSEDWVNRIKTSKQFEIIKTENNVIYATFEGGKNGNKEYAILIGHRIVLYFGANPEYVNNLGDIVMNYDLEGFKKLLNL